MRKEAKLAEDECQTHIKLYQAQLCPTHQQKTGWELLSYT